MRPKGLNFLIALSAVYSYLLINYLIFGRFEIVFKIVAFVQLGFILLSITPLGEAITRFIYNSRAIMTSKDREYLMPIFKGVYKTVLEEKPLASKRVKLYIDRSMSVNAYAIGSNTIVVTRGAIETLTEEQLRGMIAHELGHLYYGDTIIPLVFIGGNLYFVIAFLLVQAIKFILKTVDEITGNFAFNNIGNFIVWLCCLVITPLAIFVQGMLYLNKRGNEYKADEFAFDVGYGSELISALYVLDKLDFNDGKITVWDRLKRSHPFTDERIAVLERLIRFENVEDVEEDEDDEYIPEPVQTLISNEEIEAILNGTWEKEYGGDRGKEGSRNKR